MSIVSTIYRFIIRSRNFKGTHHLTLLLFLSSSALFPEVAHSQSEVLEDIPESKEGEADEEAESSPKVGDKGDKSVIVNLKIE